MAGHQHVEAGRVPAPHLQTVERGQGHVDGPPAVQRTGRSCRAAEGGHRPGHPQPIPVDGPPGVLEGHQGDVELFLLGGLELQRPAVELGLEAGQFGPDPGSPDATRRR